MRKSKRLHERVKVQLPATLSLSDQQSITVTVIDISLNGLLVSAPAELNNTTAPYRIKIPAPTSHPIFVTGTIVRQENNRIGLRIIRHHLDSKELLQSLITDCQTTNELFELLDDGWLDHLFEDEQGKDIEPKYL